MSLANPHDPPGRVYTVLVSGQSNALGQALPDGGEIAPMPQVVAWDPTLNTWPMASVPLPCLDYTGVLPGGVHGAWLALGQAALAWQARRQIRLTGYARGGQYIAHWGVGQVGWTKLTAAIAAAGTIDAFVWHQGEADASTAPLVAAYHDQLKDLLERVRALTDPALPIAICGLGPFADGLSDFAGIRAIQQAVAAELANVEYVSTLAYSFSDNVHLTAAGYRQLGVDLAGRLRARLS